MRGSDWQRLVGGLEGGTDVLRGERKRGDVVGLMREHPISCDLKLDANESPLSELSVIATGDEVLQQVNEGSGILSDTQNEEIINVGRNDAAKLAVFVAKERD